MKVTWFVFAQKTGDIIKQKVWKLFFFEFN